MKKLLLIFMVMLSINMTAKTITEGDFKFEVRSESAHTATLTKYLGNSAEVIIPSKVDIYDVVSIGYEAFYRCPLSSVVIPNSVTSISIRAFYGCSSLSSITIPNSVISIGESAFQGCSLLSTITIPNSVTSIGKCVFTGCSSLNEIIVEAGNTNYVSIDGILYSHDKTILVVCPKKKTMVTIPNSVTSIGDHAFSGCTTLISVTIPNSVTSIGNHAFSGCTTLISVTIPNSVTSIGDYAFSGCSSLRSATIPNAVASINKSTFEECSSLKSVTIPNSVTSIGNHAFSYCVALSSVTIPNSVTSIGNYAFNNCDALSSVSIPNSVTSIGDYAFSSCDALSSATISNTVTMIGTYTFAYCSSLKSVAIPNSVISIADYAFLECSSLNSVTIPNSVTSIGNGTFYKCYSLKSVTIPNSITSIGNGTFNGCSSLISVTIPNSVTSIGDYAFSGCSSLRSATIPNSVIIIGSYTFNGCGLLKTITIPNSVISIGNYAFSRCSSLKEISVYATTPPYAGNNTFNAVTKKAIVYIPRGTYDDYVSADGWSYFSDFRELPFTLSHSDILIAPDRSFQLGVEQEDAAAFNWTSSDPSVAYVNKYGLVTSMGVEGECVVTAEKDGNTMDCNVVVAGTASSANYVEPTDIFYESVSINPCMLNVRLEPVGACTAIDWQSGNTETATIDHGLITFFGNGGSTVFRATTGNGLVAVSPEINEQTSGVNNIATADGSVPVEHYDLTGVRVDSDALTPGIYIRKQGDKVTKILVK